MSLRILILPLLCAAALGAPPERQELQQQAARCRALLESSVIRFYLPHCLDRQNGGYFESLRDELHAGVSSLEIVEQDADMVLGPGKTVDGVRDDDIDITPSK